MESNLLTYANVALILTVTVANSQKHDSGTCYSLYVPPQSGLPARCRHAIGGNPATMEIFIRNDRACCRTTTDASGWGSENNCRSCSSIRGSLYPWGEWSSCSKTCGRGEQRRHRICSNTVCAGVKGRRKTESRACMWKTCCPVDGNWAAWSSWTECTSTCGEGWQHRTRKCSSPSPSCGGKPCRSFPKQMQSCRVGQCASWSSWTAVGPCSATCGVGNILRTRDCRNPLGDTCNGEWAEYLSCNEGSCAVDGGWCAWNTWSTCTSTCNFILGTRKRSRWCECPLPRNGGRECLGSDGDVEDCSSNANCPVKGDWSDWSSWGQCSSEKCSTSPGVRIRTRKCNNPTPRYGGTCEGQSVEERSCINIDDCKVEVYGEWSPWTPCTLSCGSCSFRMRDRQCIRSVYMFNTDVIGTPNFYCDDTKIMDKQSCEVEVCPDGSDPCGDYQYNGHSSSGETEYSDGSKPASSTHLDENDYDPYSGRDYSEQPYDDAEGDDYYNGVIDPPSDHMAGLQSPVRDRMDSYEPYLGTGSDDEFMKNIGLEDPSDNFEWPQQPGDFSDVFMRSLEDPSDETEYSGSEANDDMEFMGEHNSDYYSQVEEDLTAGSGVGEDDIGEPLNCERLDNITGQDASRAAGCCDVLKRGITNITDLSRLQECFALHYEYVISPMGEADVVMEESMQGRTVYPQCRYRKKPDYLRTICCLWKSCSNWKKKGLRDQCVGCRKRGLCQSCDLIILAP